MEKKETPEGTLFILEHPLDGRAKWLFAWYAFSFLVPALFLLYIAFELVMDNVFEIPVLLLGVAIIAIVIGIRYMASAWRLDTLLVTPGKIVLTEQKGFQKMVRSFDRAAVTNPRFLEKPELTPHPLAGKTFDYLGFQVQDQVINEMFGDHRFAFDYGGQSISFGRKLYSWDFEAISETLGMVVPRQDELPWNAPLSLEGYWEEYQAFVDSIPAAKHFIREDAEQTKLYATGLTDGWADHRDALQQILARYEYQLGAGQRKQLEGLIAFVDDIVRR